MSVGMCSSAAGWRCS